VLVESVDVWCGDVVTVVGGWCDVGEVSDESVELVLLVSGESL
jgi:hypothetical protein